MEEKQVTSTKKTSFLKRNAYYFILGAIVLCLALIIGLASIVKSPTNQDDVPANTGKIEFVSPVANATISKGFNADCLQYNKVLNEWSIHKATDYTVASGESVLACYNGKVESISTNILEGTVITIDHGNNLKTVYKSLDEEVKVQVGDEVKTGQVIGKASASATGETTETSQVHFEVWKDGSLVDPAGYMQTSEK